MTRKVFVETPIYLAEADEFEYLWEEIDKKAYGIRLYNARVTYKDGNEEFLHRLDIHLAPDSGIVWGVGEVSESEEDRD